MASQGNTIPTPTNLSTPSSAEPTVQRRELLVDQNVIRPPTTTTHEEAQRDAAHASVWEPHRGGHPSRPKAPTRTMMRCQLLRAYTLQMSLPRPSMKTTHAETGSPPTRSFKDLQRCISKYSWGAGLPQRTKCITGWCVRQSSVTTFTS